MAGTDRRLAPVLGGPAVILVEPQLGENIGAVARAMLNFGLMDLRLVRPRVQRVTIISPAASIAACSMLSKPLAASSTMPTNSSLRSPR